MFKPALLTLALATPAWAEEIYTLTNGQTVTPLEQFRECDVCPEMIVMPLGSFMMGAVMGESDSPYKRFFPEGEGGLFEEGEVRFVPHEHPRHEVNIDVSYAMGRNEVTIGEWMLCVEAGACSAMPAMQAIIYVEGEFEVDYRAYGPAHPVTELNLGQIQTYVEWLNAQVGEEVYRLPTEAEWEYAARAGTETRFFQGERPTIEQVNFSERLTAQMLGVESTSQPDWQMPVPVYQLDADNAWGLRHMSGNVAELTLSRHARQHLAYDTSSAYLAEAERATGGRLVSKGGDYAAALDFARIAARAPVDPELTLPHLGFRVVRELN